ncbi:Asp23/Gls24 family envelope stress response protein [Nocardia brasiliensis]|uniref:Asp23/Gls24 family envelope stress response protein n=1 Tax=Nocardia brasiliensis TaxID=37326 RepID=UPI0004A75B04|nr:Asp23/Gls24 family envelope stress response protein [Nocardia brasiliensis]MBF6127634.1 Asp23/Gls24 family envelope stress response protein [Nocardia brasiliensis]
MTLAVGAAEAELPGRTTVAPRAVRRIVAQAAREVAGVGRDVRVEAEVFADRTALDVRLPIAYPSPVGKVTEACRGHLARRTRELTGLAVSAIDIEVAELTTETGAGRRVR